MSGANDVKHKKSSNPNDNIYHTIVKNRKIDRMIMPFEAVYCVWLIITLVLNFKLFAYSIDAQFVLISLFFISGWVSSLVKNHCMKKSRK
ncbi:tRNA-modifying protein [Lactobacillus crispatus]|uniref:tRNA-modifying protein n=1 Tax=Lactobacillus crispatus TaxID=47770 RepID=A0A4Q0LQB0_9LACO|nr:tRNA-modifying protein [Lactobacillus crispatus]PKZ87235.1 tRNA-modifying protein [Lactobacillus crispatus]RXF57421.1 tRNA-modifying protein [Lactobacillus crispatus]